MQLDLYFDGGHRFDRRFQPYRATPYFLLVQQDDLEQPLGRNFIHVCNNWHMREDHQQWHCRCFVAERLKPQQP